MTPSDMVVRLSERQIEEFSSCLASRFQKALRGELFLIDGVPPSSPKNGLVVDGTFVLIELVRFGMPRDAAIDAVRDATCRALKRVFPDHEERFQKESIAFGTQIGLLDRGSDNIGFANVGAYCAHLLFEHVALEQANLELLGRMGASLIVNGDIGTILRETKRIAFAEQE